MPRYTFKEGMCAECGSKYNGLICEEEPQRNTCSYCRSDAAVDNAKSLYYKEFIPYWDGGLGEYITSKRHRQDTMAVQGVAEISDVASNDEYLMDDIESHARSKKRDIAKAKSETVVDNEFLEVYKEVEARSGRTI